MKAKISLFLLTMLMGVGMAFAVGGKAFYNLVSITQTEYVQNPSQWGVFSTPVTTVEKHTTFVLTQDGEKCSSATWSLKYDGVDYVSNSFNAGYYGMGMFNKTKIDACVASVADTPENLYEILKDYWAENEDNKGITLALGSDIDLGEFSSATEVGKCDVNHIPLPMPEKNAFNGNHFTIRHLCYNSATMDKPVGFFESVSKVTLQNVKLNGVRIYITSESNKGEDFYPVGALVGTTNLVTVDSVELANDSIVAPFAGGLIGFVKNSTISNITGNDDISVTNNILITDGYAGSKIMDNVFDHQVFLGGLVGVAYRSENEDATFIDDSVKVDVHDSAIGHKSALGGIAGLFSTTGEEIKSVHVYEKVKEDDSKIPSKISGGSSMGGLFGAMVVYRENNSSKEGDFTMSDCSFNGKIYDAASPNMITVGGLIGLDSAIKNMSIKIVKSSAVVDIRDTLKTKGQYRYYAGGIVGYGASCGDGSEKESDFFTIKDSKTAGTILVAASAAKVGGLNSDVYLGGLAGAACVAQGKGLGLKNDTTSVSIISRVKTAINTTKKINGMNTHDSVFVGGLVGLLDIAVTKKIDTLSGLYYDGMISVEDSVNNIFVGGAVGAFERNKGGKYVHFENIFVHGTTNLVSYTAKQNVTSGAAAQSATSQYAKIGGVCGVCNEIGGMDRVGVNGNIKVTGSYSGDSLIVGGLVGSTDANEIKTVLKGTYSIGNIDTEKLTKDKASSVLAGYVVGNALFSSQNFEIVSSYHYGEKDAAISDGVGKLVVAGNKEGWKASNSIYYVIRNGESEDFTQVHHNGTQTADVMKSSAFAAFLNAFFKESENYGKDDYVWTYISDKNDNLPLFSDSKNAPIEPEAKSHVVVFVDKYGETLDQQFIDDGKAAVAPTEVPDVEGYAFNGKWDKPFDKITSDLTVTALYDVKSYEVKFLDFDKKLIGTVQKVDYLKSAKVPDVPGRTGYTFVGWNDSSYTQVKKDLDIQAIYEPIRYLIVFKDFDDSILGKDSVPYGVVVADPQLELKRKSTKDYEYTFKGWTPALAAVSGDAEYIAVYDSVKVSVPESSSSVESSSAIASSSSAPASSSTIESSSSEGTVASSSSVHKASSSSSSEKSVESSSSKGELKLVDAKIEQSGNAVRLTFNAENANSETVARVKMIGENGTIVDTVISKDVVKGGVWEMTPSPMGRFTVELVLDNKVKKVEFEESFEVASEIEVRAESWQMVSLSALDKSSMVRDADVSFYWWDEQNPVGDYWQYRAFDGGKVEPTRGFWYGTSAGKPLVLREATGAKDSEIVWKLDSLYSGWNLVANPYGWYVDLTKGKSDDGSKVHFWRWNPHTSGYEIPTVIGPYEAVWAKAPHALTWKAPAAPVFGITETESGERLTASKKSILRKAGMASRSFALMATLADDYGKKDSWNVIGAGDEERIEEPPAGMGDHVSLAIREQSADGKRCPALAKSVKALSDEYNWTLDVSASSVRDGNLSFEGVADLLKLGLKLFITADGKTTEVSDETPVRITLAKSTKQVNVRVASSSAVVTASKISGFHSQMAGETLQIGFTAPDNLAGTAATYAIVGVDGQKVASGKFKAMAGANQFSLNAPKTGVYFVKVKVGSEHLSGKVLVK